MLSQATANALGIEVIAGPVEATSCGNVITQMMATGHLPDLAAGRDLIRRSFEFQTYQPARRRGLGGGLRAVQGGGGGQLAAVCDRRTGSAACAVLMPWQDGTSCLA